MCEIFECFTDSCNKRKKQNFYLKASSKVNKRGILEDSSDGNASSKVNNRGMLGDGGDGGTVVEL